MKTANEEAIELIQRLPDDSSMETILAELHFKQRVIRGIQQLERSEVVSHEEAKERLDQLLKSPGR